MRTLRQVVVVTGLSLALALGCGGGEEVITPPSADGRFDSRPPDGTPEDDASIVDASVFDADTSDGPVDADDTDAAEVPDGAADAAPVPVCTAPPVLTSGVARTGTVTGASAHEPISPSPCLGGAQGGEVVYRYDLAAAADLVWTVTPTGFDAVAYVRTVCAGSASDPSCTDGGGVGASEQVVVTGAAPGTYFFFVDGLTNADEGAFSATLTVRTIVGLGQTCDGTTTRCQDALTCAGGTCRTPADACNFLSQGTLTLGATASGTTTGASSDLSCVGSGSAPDQHWTLTADASGGTYVVQIASSDHSVLGYQITACDPDLAEACTGGSTQSIDFDVVLGAAESTHVVVDGLGSAQGTYTIRADEVRFLASGAACDAANPLVDRCASGTSCTAGFCAAACGNGALDAGEECDDAGTLDSDGCSSLCRHELTYGAATETAAANDSAATAQLVVPDVLVAGAIAAVPAGSLADKDFYSVALAAGEVLIAEVRSRGPNSCLDGSLNSQLRVWSSTGASLLAVNDDKDGTASPCSYILFSAPGSGTYVVEVRAGSAAAASTFQYELRLYTATPTFTSTTETETNNTLATPNTIPIGSSVAAAIGARGDLDHFAMSTIAGVRIVAATFPNGVASCNDPNGLNTNLEVYGPPADALLAQNDDVAPGNFCSRLDVGTRRVGAQKLRVGTGAGFLPPTPFPTLDYLLQVTVLPE